MPNLISHAIIVLFGVFLILFAISFTGSIRNDYRNFIAENEIDHVCLLVKGAVAKIYVTGSAHGRLNDTMGSIILRMPDRIADTNYRASFQDKGVKIETFFDLRHNMTCIIGFPAAYSGSTSGGLTSITLYHYANGSRLLEMKKI